jgi:hypothetical protein
LKNPLKAIDKLPGYVQNFIAIPTVFGIFLGGLNLPSVSQRNTIMKDTTSALVAVHKICQDITGKTNIFTKAGEPCFNETLPLHLNGYQTKLFGLGGALDGFLTKQRVADYAISTRESIMNGSVIPKTSQEVGNAVQADLVENIPETGLVTLIPALKPVSQFTAQIPLVRNLF